MIDSISIINTETKARITFSKDGSSQFVLAEGGIDWSNVDASHSSYKKLNRVGSNRVSTDLNERTVAFVGYIWSGLNISDYPTTGYDAFQQLQRTKIAEGQKKLSKLINPLSTIRIQLGDFHLEGSPEASVSFATTEKDNNEVKLKFGFSIQCFNPMFKMEASRGTVLNGTSGAFRFPMILKPGGIPMGVRTSYQLVSVENEGDVVIGGRILLKALGTVSFPVITNVYTSESIKINKVLQANEVVIIDTVNKSIYGGVGEATERYFKYWDFSNSWIDFGVGFTLIGYSAEEQSYLSLDVSIELNSSFYTIGGQ